MADAQNQRKRSIQNPDDISERPIIKRKYIGPKSRKADSK